MADNCLKVPASKLTVVCDPDNLGFETTDEVVPLEGTVGQDRAVAARGPRSRNASSVRSTLRPVAALVRTMSRSP